MSCSFKKYTQLNYELPKKTLSWNMYGAGTENIGRDGEPEEEEIGEPRADQLLVRVDAVGLCFSDVKLIKFGKDHPKLYGRNLSTNPTRVGHEASLTVIKVGKDLRDTYFPGQRLALQPDIYKNQISTAYGYTIPGGLTQYHLMGPEVLDADHGAYVIQAKGDIGYAAAALTEPWACVDAAYTQRRRLAPKTDGVMWIIGNGSDASAYTFSTYLQHPKKIYLSNTAESFQQYIQDNKAENVQIILTQPMKPEDYAAFSDSATGGDGFDDIVLLAPLSALAVAEAAKQIAFRGLMNIVSGKALKEKVAIDAGRIHYHYTTYVGTNKAEIASAYGEERNRCNLRENGTALFVGAGGPMGQMHVQRAVEKKGGPGTIVATDISAGRLAVLEEIIAPLAEANGVTFIPFNPAAADIDLQDFLEQETGSAVVDDVVVCVPAAKLMEDSAMLLKPDGMLVFFAGVPNGTSILVNMNPVFLGNLQLTGTSGSTLRDQEVIIEKTVCKEMDPNRSVAAIGGLEAARDGIDAMMAAEFAGKILIFPQISGLPLIGLKDLKEKYPTIGDKLGPNNLWTVEAEQALIQKFWCGV